MSADRRKFLAASALTAASYARIHGANERIGLGFVGCSSGFHQLE